MERIDGVNRYVTLLNQVVKYNVVENVQTLPLEELSTVYCRSIFYQKLTLHYQAKWFQTHGPDSLTKTFMSENITCPQLTSFPLVKLVKPF